MLYGREAEVTTIEALLEAARAGHGGALVVHGTRRRQDGPSRRRRPARAGDTPAANRRPRGRVQPAVLGARRAHRATARRHLRAPPTPGDCDRGALALAPPAPEERFAVCAGFLGLLSNAAAEAPMLGASSMTLTGSTPPPPNASRSPPVGSKVNPDRPAHRRPRRRVPRALGARRQAGCDPRARPPRRHGAARRSRSGASPLRRRVPGRRRRRQPPRAARAALAALARSTRGTCPAR